MTDANIKTGHDELDKDLRTLFDLSDEKMQGMEAVLQKNDFDREELINTIPYRVIRLTALLSKNKPEQITELLGIQSTSATSLLEKAQKRISEKLPSLENNPIVEEIAQKLLDPKKQVPFTPAPFTQEPSNINAMCSWCGAPGTLLPIVHIHLKDRASKTLWMTTVTLRDLAWLAQALAKTSLEALQKGQPLMENEYLDTSGLQGIEDHVRKAKDIWDKMEKLLTVSNQNGHTEDSEC